MSPEEAQKPEKNLNQRIEDLVVSLETSTNSIGQLFSYKAMFIRGIWQGLGIVIGSTIITGIGYTILTQFISPQIINDISIDAAVQRSTIR